MGSIFENFSIYCPKNSNLYLTKPKKETYKQTCKDKIKLFID